MTAVFEHPDFDRHEWREIPLDQDCWLIDDALSDDFCSAMRDMTEGGEFRAMPYQSYASIRKVTDDCATMSWYANFETRFHEVPVLLPRDQFRYCVSSWNWDIPPCVFVSGEWLRSLHVRSFSIFALVDAIGVKNALQAGALTRQKLLRLRDGLDGLADAQSAISFISFADSLLLKGNWVAGHWRHKVRYSYSPEALLAAISRIRDVFRENVGLDIYAVLTQGSNEYYDDSLLHISPGLKHICLNSLGIPFEQLQAIDRAARRAGSEGVHSRYSLYMDSCFYRALRLGMHSPLQDLPQYVYRAEMLDRDAHYVCAELDEVLQSLETDQ